MNLAFPATGYGAGSLEVDSTFGSVAVHVDTAINNDRIPGGSTQSQGEPVGGWTVPQRETVEITTPANFPIPSATRII